MTDNELQQRVRCEVARCVAIARTKWPVLADMPAPDVDFALRRRACGMANLSRNTVSINMRVLRADPAHVIDVTAAHEVAHLVHYRLVPSDYFRGRRQQHGRNWQTVMRAFGVEEPTRTYKASRAVWEALQGAA